MKEQKKRKRVSSKIKKINGLPIQLTKMRGDVVLKSILRNMRRTYIDDFNKTTKYIQNKRFSDLKSLITCLNAYT